MYLDVLGWQQVLSGSFIVQSHAQRHQKLSISENDKNLWRHCDVIQSAKTTKLSSNIAIWSYAMFHVRSSSGFGDISQNVKGAALCPPAARGLIKEGKNRSNRETLSALCWPNNSNVHNEPCIWHRTCIFLRRVNMIYDTRAILWLNLSICWDSLASKRTVSKKLQKFPLVACDQQRHCVFSLFTLVFSLVGQ